MTQFNKSEVMSMMQTPIDSNLSLRQTAASGDNAMKYNALSDTAANTMAYVGDPINNTGSSTIGTAGNISCWGYWRDYYYPTVIHESYPVYVREQAQDKGKKAYEIIKILKDKKLAKLEKVADFIDLMDALIGIL